MGLVLVKTNVKIEFDKSKLDKIRAEFRRAGEAFVSIGVHEGAGEYPGGPSVVQVALWNEFGTERPDGSTGVPSRPFIREAVHAHTGQINAWRQQAIKKIAEGEWTVKKGLEFIGFRVRELIKNNILSDMPPPNAPSTAARKRAAGIAPRTLFETGLLLRSIEYKVEGV